MPIDVPRAHRLGKSSIHSKHESYGNNGNGIEKYFGIYNSKDPGSERPRHQYIQKQTILVMVLVVAITTAQKVILWNIKEKGHLL